MRVFYITSRARPRYSRENSLPSGETWHHPGRVARMELPDEAVTYQYQGLLMPANEEWTAAAELRARYFLSPTRLKDFLPRLMQAKSQVAAEREARTVPP